MNVELTETREVTAERGPFFFKRELGKEEGEYKLVGREIERPDAFSKIMGLTKFTADRLTEDVCFGKIVRSKYPHALIKRVIVDEALQIKGVLAVITAKDVPGENQIGYAIPDQPLLADKKVRYIGEPIAIVVAENEYAAEKGVEAVKVEYDPLPAVFDPLEALKPEAPKVHEKGNVALTTIIRKGDVEKGFKEADVVVENIYYTQRQEHAYLEPEAAIAYPEGDGIRVVLCTQSPFLVREFVSRVTGYSQSKIKVIGAPAGGAFGGKDDMGPMVASKAALAAIITKKPVAIILDKEETFVASNKRHPAIIRYKSGATKDGKLTAVEIEIIYETGAYANRSPFVLWRATVHSAGPYVVPNAKVDGKSVYTNKVFSGSFRGFGDPQIHVAAEQQMDELAEKLGIDPVEFRLRNVLKEGTRTVCNQLLEESVGMEETLKKVAEAANWKKKREELKKYRKGSKVRGIGVACAYHGISTSRGVPDWSAAAVLLNEDGTITYRSTITRLGQGSLIGHAKIVAEILDIPLEWVHIEEPDTSASPNARPTHGSRGLMTGGTAAADAALKLRRTLIKLASELLNCDEKNVKLENGKAFCALDPSNKIEFSELAKETYQRGYQPAYYGFYFVPRRYFDPETGLGVAYCVYTYIANIVEVEVDKETGEVKVLEAYTGADVGKAIDPGLIEGQMQGALAQGIGYAISEEVAFNDGKIINPNYTDYIIPTVKDVPRKVKVVIIEKPYSSTAFGAKGVAEAALIPTAPAIANAVAHATGVRVRNLPLTKEKVCFKLKEGKK